MRLTGLLVPMLLGTASALGGCAYAGNPFDGFGGFIGDTHNVYRGVNSPRGDSINLRRVRGGVVDAPPLTPEPGNVWPGPQAPDPTLEDLEKQQNTPGASNGAGGYYSNAVSPPGTTPTNPPPGTPDPRQRPIERGSSTPPGSVQPPLQTPGVPRAPTISPTPQGPPPIRSIPTPQGPAFTNPGSGGVQTYTVPGGGTGIVVPNGNGTNTLIGPDGSVSTAPQR